MKNIFRHYSTWLLLVGVAVSLFAFLNGADVYQRVQYALAEVNDYQYKNSYSIYLSDINDMKEAISELNELEGNVVISDNHVFLDATGYYYLVDLIVKRDEEYPYPVEYITDKHGVILGENLREYCYMNEDSDLVIKINREEQIVSGFVGTGYSDILDGKMIIELDEGKIDELFGAQDTLNVEYGSNEARADTSFDSFFQIAKEKYSIFYEKNQNKYIEVGSNNANKEFYMIIAFFAIINCVVISEFWILRRKEEILIRKLWGFSNLKLFGLMYKEMFLVSCVAAGVNLLIRSIFFIINKNEAGAMFIQKLLIAFIFIIISSFIMVLLPIYYASKYRISDGLES